MVKQAQRIPFKQPDFEDPFSIYYNSEDLAADDYLLYNYDYVDEQDTEHGLPIKGDWNWEMIGQMFINCIKWCQFCT